MLLYANFLFNAILSPYTYSLAVRQTETFIFIIILLNSPFLFLQEHNGKNLGSKKGWDLPLKSSTCRETNSMSIFSWENLEICKNHYVELPITINGVKAFDYSRDFTIAAWMKIDTKIPVKYVQIVQSDPTHFAFYEKGNEKAFALYFEFTPLDYTYTTYKYEDSNSWQHVAVVFKQPRDIKFYCNAKELPLMLKLEAGFKFAEPKLFKFVDFRVAWFGFIAMVQRSLSEEEISKLMKTFVLN